MGTIEDLEKLVELKEKGILTAAEFRKAKAKVMARDGEMEKQPTTKRHTAPSTSVPTQPIGDNSQEKAFGIIGAIIVFILVILVIAGISGYHGESKRLHSSSSQKTQQAQTNKGYTGTLTCEFQRTKMPLTACLRDSNVKVRSGNFSKVYQPYQLTDWKLSLDLKGSFEVFAQNTASGLLLRFRIKDNNTGRIIYDDSVGQYDSIAVADWML